MSKTIASLMVALLGVAGYQLSDSAALEVAMLIVQVGGILAAWVFRASRKDVSILGIRQ